MPNLTKSSVFSRAENGLQIRVHRIGHVGQGTGTTTQYSFTGGIFLRRFDLDLDTLTVRQTWK
ncbi:MAG: hypothetical protein HQ567_00540, partial [Candidatus Nealsonbacteria bacterium]|nr:hypothetical protein [Candidatus Nealsonbacteria bacterium]